MHVFISLEHRFDKYDGRIYDKTVYDFGFWKPYLDAFEQVAVAARAAGVASIDESHKRVDMEGLSFFEIPDFSRSPRSLLLIPQLFRKAREIVESADMLIIRAPCNFGLLLSWYAGKLGKPYTVEMVGDLWDAASTHPLPLKILNRYVIVPLIQRQCRGAAVASYVTKSYLQQRFTPGPRTLESAWSDNRMSRDDLIPEPRTYKDMAPLKMVYTANFTEYKGHKYLMDVMQQAVKRGVDCRLTLIGGGSGRAEVERAALKRGIMDRICFLGQIGNREVIRALDENDLYITTSMQEGLPRAIVEAEGRGLPVVGFRIGGIPELVSDEYLVAPRDVSGLVRLIERLSKSPDELSRMSAVNLETAAGYISELQAVERTHSYTALRCAAGGSRDISPAGKSVLSDKHP
jgi:glycosyltransferase involved in cell wall biosynthesis